MFWVKNGKKNSIILLKSSKEYTKSRKYFSFCLLSCSAMVNNSSADSRSSTVTEKNFAICFSESMFGYPLSDSYMVYASQDDQLEEGEFYYSDIIGCQVYDENETHLGEVIHILEMPTQDILEIEDPKGKTFMVPYVDAFIIDEDYDNDRLVIRLIEGMR